MKRHLYEWMIAGLACASLAFVSIGCQGDSGGGGGAAGDSGPRMNVEKTFKKVAGWYPADTVALAFVDNMDSALGTDSVIPPVEATGLSSGKPGTPKAMAKDIEKMMNNRFGVNPTDAKGLVFGGGMTQQALILLGDFNPSGDAVTKSKVAGKQAFKFPTKNFSKSMQEMTDAVWATKLDGGASGLAFFRSKSQLKTAIEAKPSSTLEKGNFRKTYDKLVAASSDDGQTSRLTVVSPLGQLPQAALVQSQAPFPLPKGVALNIGSTIEVTAQGEKKTLDEIEKYVEKNLVKKMDEQMSEQKKKMNKSDIPAGEQASAITGYHLITAYKAQLKPNRSDKQLTYSVAMPFSHMSPVATLGVLGSIGAAGLQQYLSNFGSGLGGGGMGGGGLGGGGMGGGGLDSPPPGGMKGGDAPSQKELEEMQKKLKQEYGDE